MQPKPHIVDLPVYQPGKPIEEVQKEYGLDEVVKLASNENPYGFSPRVRDAIESELSKFYLYPDGASVELTAALAEHLSVQPDRIIFGCGSDEVIALIARAFLMEGDETIMADCTFSVYKSNADIEQAVSIEVPLKDGKHDLDAMLAAVSDRTKIVWICNPNNPTGTIVNRGELRSFLDRVPSSVMVVLDEAYFEYVTDSGYPDGLTLLADYPNVVVLRTFSKIYGLAALRIGYGVGSAEVIRSINQVREPFNTTRIAQAAAKAALADQSFVQSCREKNAEGIQYLEREFGRLGLESFPANGNFIMVDTRQSAADLFQRMLRKGVIARSGFKRYPTYLRVTVGSPRENEIFIRIFEETLSERGATV
ncbi:histidinol-phosphate transaminase [Saccharibacillus sp. CPCC 101409]|uniref:histidinol-phosphate transaminase n=1 Tax=Saccharibacillus sp. CPCC 101409 TaxID=3058041 RepID=UPI0026736F25|nr:histidinol-phosphate transaminase [Saccharibacillus sp. CPCC 101409]MDO3409617.1 histidinol-phosphate transaminase [Saccharibacillus sp. CPCC 101409]